MSAAAQRLILLLGEEIDGALAEELCAGAEKFVLAYTRRAATNAALDEAALQIAVIAYNRRGMEGQSRHAEGSLSVDLRDLPAEWMSVLRAHRIVGTARA